MQHYRLSSVRKPRAALVRVAITLVLLLLLTDCPRPELPGSEPLEGFYAKVAAQVTTSVRSHLRGDQAKQDTLKAKLPSLEAQPTMADLIRELKAVEPLSMLAQPIQAGVTFELGKPEHQEIKSSFDSPEIQRNVVAAIVQGMRKALAQNVDDQDVLTDRPDLLAFLYL